MKNTELIVIGGGLAGCEAAWQAAERGIQVSLFEMRPINQTPAHQTGDLAELICSNSMGSMMIDRGSGLLIQELELLGSMLIRTAMEVRVAAGSALAVDRSEFSQRVTARILAHPNISVTREEVTSIPESPCVVASGPLTSPGLTLALERLTGSQNLFFYDAIAPIIIGSSIDPGVVFRSSRYGRGDDPEGDYLNCPLNAQQYIHLVDELVNAKRIPLADFESDLLRGVQAGRGVFFERCLPIEELASRGPKALSYGPLRPTGLTDPKTGRWPKAVVQLRREDKMGEYFNLVGFQTNLLFSEQERVFRLIPGLERAEFIRHGQMHRNTYLCAPVLLNSTLNYREREDLFFAGQLVGVEGYAGNIASGLVAGINSARQIKGQALVRWPCDTMIGALLDYLGHAAPDQFQPMKANFGLLPPIGLQRRSKRQQYQDRAQQAIRMTEGVRDLVLPA